MNYSLSNRLVAWWALVVAVVVSAHFLLDYFGWEHELKGIVEALLAATLMVVPYVMIRRRVMTPLGRLKDAAVRLTAGDMTARADVESPAEFKELADSFNGMVDELEAAYEQMKATSLTLEKAVEERTRAVVVERDKLSAMLRSIPDGVVFIGISGEILEVNPMMADIWGIKPEDLTGKMVEALPDGPLKSALTFECGGPSEKHCWEVMGCSQKDCPAYDSGDMRCWLVSGTFCHKGVQVSVRRKREDVCSQCTVYRGAMERCGEMREVEVSGRHYKITSALVLDDGNRVMGELKTFNDVTEARLLELKKADLASMITHDLRSPLSSIMGYADIIMDDESVPEAGREYAAAIKKGGRRLLGLVEQYMDIARIDTGQLTLNRSRVDAAALIEEVKDDLMPQAMAKGITVEVSAHPELGEIDVDRDKMLRVVENLASNAIKFAPEGGRVVITAQEYIEDGTRQAEICVSDNGDGIPEEDLPHVFDRYYRSMSAQGIKGFGVGLAVVKSFTEAHDGKVSVESRPGEGTKFRVCIPMKNT
ncbi:MAG: HAMP domain-containing protein [Nitrospirae bacterium]|nr:HAMP domain-containing protein [Nitrospirota bacterium]